MAARKSADLSYGAACKAILRMYGSGFSSHIIAKKLNESGYFTANGGLTWYFSTVQRVIDKHNGPKKPPTPPKARNARSKAAKSAQHKPLATMPTTPAPEQQSAPTTEARRGLKRMTRAGWESLPEPVREAVVERIFREVVGQ